MIGHYLKIALRNILKKKAYAAINIFSLGLSLSVCLLVGLFIYQQLSYDNFHSQGGRIYRITRKVTKPNYIFHSAETPALLAPTIQENFPEIAGISRIYFSGKKLVASGDRKFYEENLVYADPDFFEIFSFSALAVLISVFVAFMTSFSQTIRAAETNPADVLKYE